MFHGSLASHFFTPPHKTKKHWNGIVTTNGISCSWHLPCTSKARARRKPTVDTLSVDLFKRVPGHEKCQEYGTHAQDLFVHPSGALDIVAVDPGHVTLVDAVRYHASGGVPVPPVPSHDASRRGKRRYALQHKLAERNLTRFSMSNAHW
jgi:hypothetical protein